MSRQIIAQDGKPTFVVIPIEEWRRIEVTLEGRAAVRTFLKDPTEAFSDAVVSSILGCTPPLKALRFGGEKAPRLRSRAPDRG